MDGGLQDMEEGENCRVFLRTATAAAEAVAPLASLASCLLSIFFFETVVCLSFSALQQYPCGEQTTSVITAQLRSSFSGEFTRLLHIFLDLAEDKDRSPILPRPSTTVRLLYC